MKTNFLTRKERLEDISKGILNRYFYDFNIPPMDKETKSFTSRSWEQHLTNANCPPSEYDKVYDLAVEIYRKEGFGKGPFNVVYLLVAWERIQAERQREFQTPKWEGRKSNRLQLNAAPVCEYCSGTTMDFNRDEAGRCISVKYIKTEKGTVPAPCPKCSEVDNGEQKSNQE